MVSALYGALVFAAYHYAWAYAAKSSIVPDLLPCLNWLLTALGLCIALALWQRSRPYDAARHTFKFNGLRIGLSVMGVGVVLVWGKGFNYSLVAFAALGLVLVLDDLLRTHLTNDTRFWQLLGLLMLPALAWLAALPYALGEVYHYAPRSGIEFWRLPLENILLAAALVAGTLVAYEALLKRAPK